MKPYLPAFFSLGALLLPLTTLAAEATTPAGPHLTARAPANQAKDVCPDTRLTLTFDTPFEPGNTGQVRIYDAADDHLVETVDTSVPATSQNYIIGGANNFHLYPVLSSGPQAIIYPHAHKLEYNKTYYVQVDEGVLRNATGTFPGFQGKTAWVFTTKAAPPSKDATQLVVAADGSGDFATVQGAIDFAPEQPAQRMTIFIRKGLYPEIVYFSRKNNLTFLGEDRKGSVIRYSNNANFNGSHRGLFGADRSTGIILANLTLKNSTPKGGSQAECIIMSGGKNILAQVDLSSLQDTLQISDSAYVADCYIEGDVDFMWGRGPVFFKNCEVKALNRGYYTQIRNTEGNHGFVYDHCTFSTAPNATGMYLSRIAPSTYPASEVVLLDCALGAGINPVGWLLNTAARGGVEADPATQAPNLHFWEFNSTNISDGKPADVSKRAAFSKQLTMEKDAETIKNYRDPAYVMGWKPDLASLNALPLPKP